LNGNLDVSGTTVSAGKITADAGIDIDNINIDGTTIALSSGDLTLDAAGDIILDADTGVWRFKDAGTTLYQIAIDGASVVLYTGVSDAAMVFKGNDGGSTVTALTLDMSEAGAATFNAGVTAGALLLTSFAEIRSDTATLYLENAANTRYYSTKLSGANPDLVTSYYDGTSVTERMRIDSSGNVGISESNPVAKIHIQGSGTSGQVTSSLILENSSSGTAGLQITGTAGSSHLDFMYGGGPSTGTNTLTTGMSMTLEGSGAGNVGIGVTPTEKLDISQSVNNSVIAKVTNTNSGDLASARVEIYNDNSSFGQLTTYSSGFAYNVFGSNAANWTFLGTSGSNSNGLKIGTLTADPVVFGTSDLERLRIDAAGNAGLGVVPSAWSVAVPALQLGICGAFLCAQGATEALYLGSNAYYNGTNWIYAVNAPATYYRENGGAHAWFNAPSGTTGDPITFTQAMTLDASGNLYLGATSGARGGSATRQLIKLGTGQAYLEIQSASTSSTSDGLLFSDGSAGNYGLIQYSHSDDTLNFFTASTERMRINADGVLQSNGYSVVASSARPASGTLRLGNIESTSMLLDYDDQSQTIATVRNQYGTTDAGAELSLDSGFITFNTGTSFTERMRIDASGNLLVGDTSTVPFDGTTGVLIGGARTSLAFATTGHTHKMLYSVNTGTAGLHFYDSTNNRTDMIWDNSGNLLVGTTNTANLATHTPNVITDESFGINDGTNIAVIGLDRISFNAGNYYVLNESATGVKLVNGATSWTTQSDENSKENIVELSSALTAVNAMRCVRYNLKSQTPDDVKIGFIAQDWQSSYPEVVATDTDGTLGMNYTETIPVLLKAIQELSAQIEALTARIAALES
jgi:hypothetical protein